MLPIEDALRSAINESLDAYIFSNAIFLAERLYAEVRTLSNLHLVAHCYVVSGDAATAFRLLQHELSSPEWPPVAPGADTPLWQCRFLCGVAAAQAKCFLEAEKILTDLSPVTPAVRHWLGVCGRELQRRWAGEYFFKAASTNTNLVVSYELAVKLAGSFPTSPYEKSTPTVPDAPEASETSPAPRGAASHSHLGHHQHHDPTFVSASSGGPAPVSGVRIGGGSRAAPQRVAASAAGGSGVAANSSTAPSTSPALEMFALLRRCATVARLLHSYKCAEVLTQIDQLPTAQRRSGWAITARALAHFHMGSHLGAWNAFRELRQAEPWRLNDPALIAASTALWHLRKDVELGTLAQTMVQVLPHSPITMCVVGNCYSLAREHKAAIQILTRATQADKMLAIAHALRGHEFLALDQNADAEMCFDAALRCDSRLYIGYAGFGEQQLRVDKVSKAQKYFQMAIDINPLPSIQNRLGATYMRPDAPPESIREGIAIFDRVLRAFPANYGARIQRASALLMLRLYEEALGELQALAADHPTEALVRLKLGECLFHLGRRAEAAHVFHEAQDLDPRRAAVAKRWMETVSSAKGSGGTAATPKA